MSLTILVRACIRNGGIGVKPAAIEAALRNVDRGDVRDYFPRVGQYDFHPHDLTITVFREVGLGGQISGVSCAKLVAEDTLAAIRLVCPTEGVEVQAYCLDFVKEAHAVESHPLPLPELTS